MTQGYQEICFALRYGALVKRKATMSYTARVTRCSTDTGNVARFTVPNILAINEREAAHHAAEVIALQLFPDGGGVSFFQQTNDGRYLASAGSHKFANGHWITIGVTLSVQVEEEIRVN